MAHEREIQIGDPIIMVELEQEIPLYEGTVGGGDPDTGEVIAFVLSGKEFPYPIPEEYLVWFSSDKVVRKYKLAPFTISDANRLDGAWVYRLRPVR